MTENKLFHNNPTIDFSALEDRLNSVLNASENASAKTFKSPAPNYFNLSISQLLNLKEKQFIEACFCTILGRATDESSVNHYLNKLHQGYDPRAIIAFMRYSKEGKLRFKESHHQLPPLAKYRIFSFPVIGKVVSRILPLYRKIRGR